MIPEGLRKALQEYKKGEINEADLEQKLAGFPFEDLGFAKVDHHRSLRHGFAEVIFGSGKSTQQIISIATSILSHSKNLLITKANQEVFVQLQKIAPNAIFHPACGAISVRGEATPKGRACIGVLSAGTADIPVAEEAAVTCRVMGQETLTHYDVGVAGLHRILQQLATLRRCSVAVVAAGMEGALPSVVGGLLEIPIIAVPTSIGYGASFGGLAALLGMLNSCASNVTVVNIDNGFGAGYVASLINRKCDFDSC